MSSLFSTSQVRAAAEKLVTLPIKTAAENGRVSTTLWARDELKLNPNTREERELLFAIIRLLEEQDYSVVTLAGLRDHEGDVEVIISW